MTRKEERKKGRGDELIVGPPHLRPIEYPVVKKESFILSNASATPLYVKLIRRKCAAAALLTAC